ncbi:MAG: hypothetical protein JW942_02845 [Opitutales bacterium]|nr:hypothetical protein [Opitutales bacterium]
MPTRGDLVAIFRRESFPTSAPRCRPYHFKFRQVKNFHDVVTVIARNDTRYDTGAYEFMRAALDYTFAEINKQNPEREGPHISGQELLAGIRDYALAQFGPMAMPLFRQWGIHEGRDFGNIVFNLVEYGVFGKTETDSIEDFDNVYDFEDVFVKPFLPPSKRA